MSDNQVSKEQIAQAKQMDLLTYLQTFEPHELVCINARVYSTKNHDSVKISNGKWVRWATGEGGKSALDYLIKVKGMDFVTAVQHLCNKEFSQAIICNAKSPPKPPFRLPKPSINNDRVKDYLFSRGIGVGLIKYCVDHALLYEDDKHNCCFVGYDGVIPKYAMLRSSNPNSTFLREADGSDKRYSFRLPEQKDSNRLMIFESPIDSLSYVELEIMSGNFKPCNYLSLSGIYQPKDKIPAALEQFLSDNPNIKYITLCLDSDRAGIAAAQAISGLLKDSYAVDILPPKDAKDYSEQLMKAKNITQYIKTRSAANGTLFNSKKQEETR